MYARALRASQNHKKNCVERAGNIILPFITDKDKSKIIILNRTDARKIELESSTAQVTH